MLLPPQSRSSLALSVALFLGIPSCSFCAKDLPPISRASTTPLKQWGRVQLTGLEELINKQVRAACGLEV